MSPTIWSWDDGFGQRWAGQKFALAAKKSTAKSTERAKAAHIIPAHQVIPQPDVSGDAVPQGLVPLVALYIAQRLPNSFVKILGVHFLPEPPEHGSRIEHENLL